MKAHASVAGVVSWFMVQALILTELVRYVLSGLISFVSPYLWPDNIRLFSVVRLGRALFQVTAPADIFVGNRKTKSKFMSYKKSISDHSLNIIPRFSFGTRSQRFDLDTSSNPSLSSSNSYYHVGLQNWRAIRTRTSSTRPDLSQTNHNFIMVGLDHLYRRARLPNWYQNVSFSIYSGPTSTMSSTLFCQPIHPSRQLSVILATTTRFGQVVHLARTRSLQLVIPTWWPRPSQLVISKHIP